MNDEELAKEAAAKLRAEQEAADKAERERLAELAATAYLLDSDTAINAASDLDSGFVVIPEWAGPDGNVPKVRVRSLSSEQQQRYWDMRMKARETGAVPPGGISAVVCAMGMIRGDGSPIYPNEMAGAAALGRKHPEIIARIANEIQRLSNMTKWQRDALEKKSEAATSADSHGSSSPVASLPSTV